MDTAQHYSLQSNNKSRVDSFDSIDSSFDVVSIDESIEEQIEIESDLDEDEKGRDDPQDDEWEDLVAATDDPDDNQVEIKLVEGFTDAIQAALESPVPQAAMTVVKTNQPSSPRRPSARELLRAFYLARAKNSEERSKNYRTYEPPAFKTPVAIPPLQAPERYDVELYERAIRAANERNAQQALHEFYAERNAMNAQRAIENRATERFVYASQIGSSALLGMLHGTTVS